MNKRWRWLRMTTFCMEILRDFWKPEDTWHQPSPKPNAAANLFPSRRVDFIMLAHCWFAPEKSMKPPNIFRERWPSAATVRKHKTKWERYWRTNKKPPGPFTGLNARSVQIRTM